MASDKMTKFEKNLDDWRTEHPRHWVATTDKDEAAEFISKQANKIVEQQVKSADKLIASQDRLQDGLRDINIGIDRVARGIENLSSTFEWGFSELIWQIEQEREVLQEILETLQAPLDTKAKERRERAVKAFHNGWMDDALDEFLEAEKRNKFDFIVHFYLGNIYLNHKKDPEKALEYYQKAVKYSKPESEFHASYAFLNIAKVKYLLEEYQEAKEATAEAIALSPDFDFAHYEHARYSAITGDYEEAIDHLKKAIKSDRQYALKAGDERDFEDMKDKFRGLIRRLRGQTKKVAEEETTKARKYIADGEKHDAPVSNYRNGLERAESLISNGSLFDCQDALRKATQIQEKVLNKTITHIKEKVSSIKNEIEGIKKRYKEKKEQKEDTVSNLRPYLLWGSGIFFFIVVPISSTLTFFLFLGAVLIGPFIVVGIINKLSTLYIDNWSERKVKEKTKTYRLELPKLEDSLKRTKSELKKLNGSS